MLGVRARDVLPRGALERAVIGVAVDFADEVPVLAEEHVYPAERGADRRRRTLGEGAERVV